MTTDNFTGTIKFFNEEKGFGFVQQDNGEGDLFIHKSNIADNIVTLNEGDKVSFEVRQSPRTGKPEAFNLSYA